MAVDEDDNLRAGCIVIFLPALFTSSQEVISTMRTFLPFMCTALVIHTASMATEGMLLAGALPWHHPASPYHPHAECGAAAGALFGVP